MEVVTISAVAWIPCLLLERSPRRWWLSTTLLSVPIMFGFMFLAPIAVDPLFHDFHPLRDKAAEAEILALARRAGIDDGRIFEVDMSKKTSSVNAYVKGFLGTKRIVLWDTLLAKLDRRQALFVMGHEMGHYVLGHVVRSLLLGAVGLGIVLGFVHLAGSALIRRFGPRWKIDRLGDLAALPLLLFLGRAFVLAAMPIGMAYSRYQEHEADRFALELTRDNHAGALGFAKMQDQNLSYPRPDWLAQLWMSTHPSPGERIDFCNTYRPWAEGKPLRYASLFQEQPPAP